VAVILAAPAMPHLCRSSLSPHSQRAFFQSDKEGKTAIYMMHVERLMGETGEDEAPF
jgi:hypothetical protein